MDERFLDHVAPFSQLMGFPLYLSDEQNQELASKYYPLTKVVFCPQSEMSADLFDEYDLLFQSTFWRPDEKFFFSMKRKKKLLFAYLPHGNSDKGHRAPMMDLVELQDFVLIYGKQMVERLQKIGVWKDVRHWAFLGNYREMFYRQHQDFYNAIVQKEIFSSLDRKKMTCLYAPTWQDPEHSSSFFSVTKDLIEQLPQDFNLLIKPHPLLEENSPALYHAMLGLCERKNNIKVIEKMPLIYPLLSFCDLYLGDFSSIGYDFTTFQRPMFFFPSKKKQKDDPAHLLRGSGLVLPERTKIFSFIEKNLFAFDGKMKEKQKAMAQFAFGEKKSLAQIREEIHEKILELWNGV